MISRAAVARRLRFRLMPARARSSRLRPTELGWSVGFLVPALAGVGLFVVFPLFQAMFLATRGTDIKGDPTRAVGLENFQALLSADFARVLAHTLVFTVIVVVGGTALPTALAVPLAQRLPGMRVFRTLFTLPFAYSASTASVVWLIMFSPSMSPVNWLIGLFGAQPPDWTTGTGWAMFTVAWITLWMTSGFNLLVLAAALTVWSFLQGWNMYFWPLIISSTNNSLNTSQTAVFALKTTSNPRQTCSSPALPSPCCRPCCWSSSGSGGWSGASPRAR